MKKDNNKTKYVVEWSLVLRTSGRHKLLSQVNASKQEDSTGIQNALSSYSWGYLLVSQGDRCVTFLFFHTWWSHVKNCWRVVCGTPPPRPPIDSLLLKPRHHCCHCWGLDGLKCVLNWHPLRGQYAEQCVLFRFHRPNQIYAFFPSHNPSHHSAQCGLTGGRVLASHRLFAQMSWKINSWMQGTSHLMAHAGSCSAWEWQSHWWGWGDQLTTINGVTWFEEEIDFDLNLK